MASPELWLEALSLIKALFDAIKSGADIIESYQKHRKERDTIQESQRVSAVYSTYSEDEIRAMILKLKGCRDRFIQQGGGKDRSRCICSILNEVVYGNGGKLPHIDDWENIYSQLGCTKKV